MHGIHLRCQEGFGVMHRLVLIQTRDIRIIQVQQS